MTLTQTAGGGQVVGAVVIWSARVLLAVVSGYLFLLAYLGGDRSFIPAFVVIAATVAASFKWPEVAPLLVMLLCALALVALTVNGFGLRTGTVDVTTIESQIASDLRDDSGVAVEVTCPDYVNGAISGMVTCELVRAGGTTDQVIVHVEDGDLRWWRIR